MKKLMLVALAAVGFAFASVPKSEAGVSVGIGFGFPAAYPYPYYYGYGRPVSILRICLSLLVQYRLVLVPRTPRLLFAAGPWSAIPSLALSLASTSL